MSAIGKAYVELLTEEPPVVAIAGAAALKAATESYGDDIPPDVQEFLDRMDDLLDELGPHFDLLEALNED